jgi:hypothetical protein
MKQAPLYDGLSLDPFSLHQDGLAASEIDVGGSEIVEALVIAPMIVALDDPSGERKSASGQTVCKANGR